LQRVANRGNEYVVLYEYLKDSVRWLEVAVYARIGAYHILQGWYLNEQGVLLPRVWSKGLSANMDHTHHPYWRLDFDIGGPDHNRVWRFDPSKGWRFYSRETTDTKETTITVQEPPKPGECDKIRERVAELKDQIQGATGAVLHSLAAQLARAQNE